MNLDRIHSIYFIGIGGIGMSALARYFAGEKEIGGYDKTQTPLTDALSEMGMVIHYEDDPDLIPSNFRNVEHTLVVYTPAIPSTHRELNFFRSQKYTVVKRSELLGLITHEKPCLAVAGTHGKTTTSTILAHLLHECGVALTAFLGGVSENYNSNLVHRGTDVFVVEADEYDRSFLTLRPTMACITSVDADHLDIYGSHDKLLDSFNRFSRIVRAEKGQLFVHVDVPIPGITYGLNTSADITARNIRIEDGSYYFDLKLQDGTLLNNIQFNLPGRHNLSNAIIALAMAIEYGCSPYDLVRALASFKGVKRRFTYHIKSMNKVLIDDYAHHPSEIDAVYDALREMYPNDAVLVVFQPHLYSRTRDFATEFANSLSRFDHIILLNIYPARELPIEGVDSDWLCSLVNNPNKQVVDKAHLNNAIEEANCRIVVTMGAGDIGQEVESIKEHLSIAS